MDPRNKPIWRVLRATAPAAGNEISITPDTAAHWLLWSIRLTLTTDANVANRHVVLTLSDGGGDYARLHAGSVQAASTAVNYSGLTSEQGNATVGVEASFHFPDGGLWIPQGHTLASVTANIQAGDAFTNIRGMLYEFPTGPREFMWPLRHLYREESS